MDQAGIPNPGPLSLKSGNLPTELSGGGTSNQSDYHSFPLKWSSTLKINILGVDLLVPGVGHITKCNGMRKLLTDQTEIWIHAGLLNL